MAVAGAIAAAITVAGPPPATAGSAAVRGAATPSDTSPPRLRDIRFSRTSVKVRGLAVVPVTVSVHLTDPSGVDEIPYAMTPSPQVTLGPVPGWQSCCGRC